MSLRPLGHPHRHRSPVRLGAKPAAGRPGARPSPRGACSAPYPEDLRAYNRGTELADEGKYSLGSERDSVGVNVA